MDLAVLGPETWMSQESRRANKNTIGLFSYSSSNFLIYLHEVYFSYVYSQLQWFSFYFGSCSIGRPMAWLCHQALSKTRGNWMKNTSHPTFAFSHDGKEKHSPTLWVIFHIVHWYDLSHPAQGRKASVLLVTLAWILGWYIPIQILWKEQISTMSKYDMQHVGLIMLLRGAGEVHPSQTWERIGGLTKAALEESQLVVKRS